LANPYLTLQVIREVVVEFPGNLRYVYRDFYIGRHWISG